MHFGSYRNCEKLGPTNSRTDSCFTRTGRISDSRTTRQQVGLLKFALRVKGRFNPSRDSAACTIVMRWQRRFKSCFSGAKFFFETRPGTVHVLCGHFCGSTNQHAIPNRRTSAKEKEILLMWRTTFWRGTAYNRAYFSGCLSNFCLQPEQQK